jgi:DNA primase
MQFNKVFSDWLQANKITKQVQQDFGIFFNNDIVIPVHDIDGNFIFNKYRRSPLSNEKPKYWYDKGSKVSLYGIDKAKDSKTILITEGEKDCLVAWSHNIPAVTSTGGANSFQDEWKDLFTDKEVIICLDNDEAGANGMVKILEIIPHAKVLFLPKDFKDIADYVMANGDLHNLIKTAKYLNTLEDINEDLGARRGLMLPVFFHEAYIHKHTKVNRYTENKSFSSDRVTRAKEYPVTNLLEFRQNKHQCLWHNEKDASLHYFKKTNSCYCFGCSKVADAIDIYMKLHNCTFKEAVEKLQ